MRVLRRIGFVLALTAWVLMLPTAPAQAAAPDLRRTTVVVDWPSASLPMNEPYDLTAHVSPAQAGRTVHLDIWGMGGPGWSRLDTKRTDASGTVTLHPITNCADGECTRFSDKYRVVVSASGTASAARSTGRLTVVR